MHYFPRGVDRGDDIVKTARARKVDDLPMPRLDKRCVDSVTFQFPFKIDKLRLSARIHECESDSTHNTRLSKVGIFTFSFARLHLEKARDEFYPMERPAPPITQADLMMPTPADHSTPHDNEPSRDSRCNHLDPGLPRTELSGPGLSLVSHSLRLEGVKNDRRTSGNESNRCLRQPSGL